MKDKINVGEYIRTYDGIIGKIFEKDDIGESEVCIDITFLDDYADLTSFVKYEDIKKHSSKIIDLIEVNDIVKYFAYDETVIAPVDRIDIKYKFKNIADDIKILKILTHELFENQGYEV